MRPVNLISRQVTRLKLRREGDESIERIPATAVQEVDFDWRVFDDSFFEAIKPGIVVTEEEIDRIVAFDKDQL
ncbi:MAG: hypothetical protein AAF802_32270 [Planctomycetota bacterium]